MQSVFIAQPQATFRLGDFLISGFQDERWTQFRAAAAFVKRSGTKHVRGHLKSFSQRGGQVIISAGIDSGGTSAEGLGDLIAAVDTRGRICAFNNANSSSFHPKIYLFSNNDEAELVIGSGNFTEGGFFTNYEANLLLRLHVSEPAHAGLLSEVTKALDLWSTPADGLCYNLDQALLQRLISEGHVPDEASSRKESRGEKASQSTSEQALFARHAIQAAPKVKAAPEADDEDEHYLEDEDTESLVVETPTPVPAQLGVRSVFLMTLQRTDVGVGQVTAGTSRRSPEIFVPLIARDYDPAFWGWPDLFQPDPNWTGPLDKDGRGKMDRPGVMVRLGGATFPVHFWYNPDKRDLRMRSEHMRSAGAIDDILYVERSNGVGGFAYYVDVVPQGSPKHVDYLARCVEKVRNSKKLYGYL